METGGQSPATCQIIHFNLLPTVFPIISPCLGYSVTRNSQLFVTLPPHPRSRGRTVTEAGAVRVWSQLTGRQDSASMDLSRTARTPAHSRMGPRSMKGPCRALSWSSSGREVRKKSRGLQDTPSPSPHLLAGGLSSPWKDSSLVQGIPCLSHLPQ